MLCDADSAEQKRSDGKKGAEEWTERKEKKNVLFDMEFCGDESWNASGYLLKILFYCIWIRVSSFRIQEFIETPGLFLSSHLLTLSLSLSHKRAGAFTLKS
jgi:hypothetical protein